MEGNNFSCAGKKRTNVIINLILSLICFAGCIVALVIDSGYNGGFETFIVFDLIVIVIAVIAMFYPGKAAMCCYIVGTVCSFIAFLIILDDLAEEYIVLILLPIFQIVCTISSALMQVTISFVNEFLSAIGSSQILIPLESIDYLKIGAFSMVDFRSSAGRISCIFVQDANTLYRSVFENRKNRLASHTTGSVNYTQSSLIDELPEL